MIPILKENLDSICTAEILAQIKQTIMNLIKEQEDMSEVNKHKCILEDIHYNIVCTFSSLLIGYFLESRDF